MRLSSEQLAGHLKRELQPLYTVFGTEPLLALEASDRIRAKARAEGYTEREVLTADSGFKWNQLAMAGSSQSLFASRKLLELRIPTGKPGKEGGEALQNYCQSLPPDTVTLIYVPDLDWRGQKAAWFEALERAGVAVEAKPVLRRALPQWIAGRLGLQQQEADTETLDFIADRVEGNLLAAYQEVQKLALLFPQGTITFDQVREAVLDVARYDVFNLGEIMLEGNTRLVRFLLDTHTY
jgi:DNA polymerase-3 subunit delta